MNDADAQSFLDSVSHDAEVVRTEHGGDEMIWRMWGEGPAVVLLHGGSGSWMHWIHTIEAFRDTHRIIAADLPGLGDSPLPAGRYSEHTLADSVSHGIDELIESHEPFHLVGFSFGGIIGAHIALRQRGRMASLSIAGSPPFGLGSTGPANEVEPVDPSLSFSDSAPIHRRNLARLMIADTSRIDALALRIHHENLRRSQLRSRKIARTDTMARAMAQVTCTVNGIWGESDSTIHPDLEAVRSVFTIHPNLGRFWSFEGVGHWVAYEAPNRFNDALRECLAGH
jgi:2-hydroxy-6-oxonona-2,4-dienedioate hydrolase